MKPLILLPTDTAQWYNLIYEAQQQRSIHLCEDLESYLVFLLMRFTEKPELASSVLAMDFFASNDATGQQRQQLLQELGDKCLLLSGLFPGRAQRKRVRVSYFVDIGQSAYAELGQQNFDAIAASFVSMMDVLQALRDNSNPLTPLEAQELAQDVNSESAKQTLNNLTDGIVMPVTKDAHKRPH